MRGDWLRGRNGRTQPHLGHCTVRREGPQGVRKGIKSRLPARMDPDESGSDHILALFSTCSRRNPLCSLSSALGLGKICTGNSTELRRRDFPSSQPVDLPAILNLIRCEISTPQQLPGKFECSSPAVRRGQYKTAAQSSMLSGAASRPYLHAYGSLCTLTSLRRGRATVRKFCGDPSLRSVGLSAQMRLTTVGRNRGRHAVSTPADIP